MKNKSMRIYSPEKNVRIGDATITDDGEPALLVKKKKSNNNKYVEYEVVPLSYLSRVVLAKLKQSINRQ